MGARFADDVDYIVDDFFALVHAAFEHAHHNQVRTAKALGVTRNMVRTLLKRHGLLANNAADGPHDEGTGLDDEDASHGAPREDVGGAGRVVGFGGARFSPV